MGKNSQQAKLSQKRCAKKSCKKESQLCDVSAKGSSEMDKQLVVKAKQIKRLITLIGQST